MKYADKLDKKNILIVVLIILVALLSGFIVYREFIYKDESNTTNNDTSNKVENNNENNDDISNDNVVSDISEETKNELIKIVDGDDTGYSYYNLFVKFKDYNGIVNDMNINSKDSIIYVSALKYNLLIEIAGEEYEGCIAGSGSCKAINQESYLKVASKYGITDDFDVLFSSLNYRKYKDYYLYTDGGDVFDGTSVQQNFIFELVSDGIKATNNYVIDYEDKESEQGVVIYNFKKNSDGYYLYSIGN